MKAVPHCVVPSDETMPLLMAVERSSTQPDKTSVQLPSEPGLVLYVNGEPLIAIAQTELAVVCSGHVKLMTVLIVWSEELLMTSVTLTTQLHFSEGVVAASTSTDLVKFGFALASSNKVWFWKSVFPLTAGLAPKPVKVS